MGKNLDVEGNMGISDNSKIARNASIVDNTSMVIMENCGKVKMIEVIVDMRGPKRSILQTMCFSLAS